jgi:hypothetical protein
MDERMSMHERMTKDKITAVIHRSKRAAPENFPLADGWSVTFHRDYYGSMHVTFWMGSGLTGRFPTAEEVMGCLVLDAALVYEESYGEFCAELGYDMDSRKAFALYRRTLAQTDRLKAFLGCDFASYLWDTKEDA